MKSVRKYAVAVSIISSLWMADAANAAEPYTLQYTAEGDLIRPSDGAWRERPVSGIPFGLRRAQNLGALQENR
jgi:hypothetical protein